jgi:low molecular weight protein-tyrosine phosphatase
MRTRWRAARAVRRARATTETRLRAGEIRRVLVMCYGNIYRSAYLGEYLRMHAGPAVEVRSAGFHATENRPSPPRHVAMCLRRGVSLEKHRSRLVTASDLMWADTIILMDRHNWDALINMGAAPDKLIWAGALAGGDVEITDPYTKDDSGAARVIDRLESAGRQFTARLLSKPEAA